MLSELGTLNAELLKPVYLRTVCMNFNHTVKS